MAAPPESPVGMFFLRQNSAILYRSVQIFSLPRYLCPGTRESLNDSREHAVVLLSTFRELLHKWIVDVYLQTPHRGVQDLPAHRWRADTSGLPPPLPPSADALDKESFSMMGSNSKD